MTFLAQYPEARRLEVARNLVLPNARRMYAVGVTTMNQTTPMKIGQAFRCRPPVGHPQRLDLRRLRQVGLGDARDVRHVIRAAMRGHETIEA